MRLTIYPAPMNPREAFQAQIELIKQSGAAYDGGSQAWWLYLTRETVRADTLNPLFQAAREYGTHVVADSK